MISKEFVLTMAQYNAWQNKQIMEITKGMDTAELYVDHKAFFRTIMGTLNHLLLGDSLWMSRMCDDVARPAPCDDGGVTLTDTLGEWQAQRFRLDGRMRIWAQTLSNIDLAGELSWWSGALERDLTQPKALCILHMFNHQTHHRGQVHAMLTAAGQVAPVTDIVFMPKED
ncbi:damage-inducible protein DinB [Sulfitobacter sp. F26204]|uniref:DinB family protein n=1 Tax=Sulfitobacter sp. F26204 TaxID=2996014 RepID=UPI00225E451C|nr:DinB family protein [Sulfitobacter sp. F26204]MCX7559644.1 damage-inducible protein DinB [Sulfitobacter sp. F26204]